MTSTLHKLYAPPDEHSLASMHVVLGSNPFSMASIICGASCKHYEYSTW